MKQRIILSEKLRAPGDIPHEQVPLRSKRFLDSEVVGAASQGKVNRAGTIDCEFELQRPLHANDASAQYASTLSPSSFRPVRSRSRARANILGHGKTTHSVADYQERERVYAGESAPYDVNVYLGNPLPSQKPPPQEQKNNAYCFSGPLENVCSLRGRGILQLFCIIILVALVLHFTSTNGGVTNGNRSILFDALPWVFRATNISAQQSRSKVLWENHIVLSDDNRILIPETFESRWNVEVAPLLENQLHRIWDELPTMQCSIGERVYAGFSLKESQSLPATVSFDSKCNPDSLPRLCTQQRHVADLRQINIELPSKSSRSSYSVTISMNRSIRANDVTFDPDTMPTDVKGIVQFHLSDSSMIALVRYCSERRQHFSDNIEQKYAEFNKVGVISLYELKRMYALTSRNRRGASYLTELWDADELSRTTFDPVEYSWHSLTRTNWKQFKLRGQDSLDEQNDKPSSTNPLRPESVTNDREMGLNTSEAETRTEEKNISLTKIPGSPEDALRPTTSSPEHINKKSQNDVSKVSSPRDEDKSESKFIETASVPKTDGNDEQREAQDEDEVLPDIPQEVEEPDEDDDTSTEVQSQDENAERHGSDSLSQNRQFFQNRQESTVPEIMDFASGTNPQSSDVAPREENYENTSESGNPATMSQVSASASNSQVEPQATENTNQERILPSQGHTSESNYDEMLSQSSLSQVRDSEEVPRVHQSRQMVRQGEPNFLGTLPNSLSSQPAPLPPGNAVIPVKQSQSISNPHSLQSVPQSSANRLSSGETPLHVGSAEPPSESFQPAQVPSKVLTPRRADRSELLPQVAPLRIRDSETYQKGFQSTQTAQSGLQTHQIVTLQQASLRTNGGQVQQEPFYPSDAASARVPILPRAHRVVGVQNQFPKRRESQPQIHSHRAFEETRDSRTAMESRAIVSNNDQRLSGFREELVGRRPPSHINTLRSPPNRVGGTTYNP